MHLQVSEGQISVVFLLASDLCALTWGEGSGGRRSRDGGTWGVNLPLGTRLADHVVCDEVAVEDVPRSGDEATTVADTCMQRVESKKHITLQDSLQVLTQPCACAVLGGQEILSMLSRSGFFRAATQVGMGNADIEFDKN